MNKTKGIALALISSGTFGLIALFSIPLLKVGMHAPSILFYRCVFATVVLGVICLVRKKEFRISPKAATLLFFLGMLYTITAMGLIYSYNFISSGVSTTIHFLYPVSVACMMIIFYKEKLSRNLLFAAVLSLTGVALLCWSDTGFISTKGLLAVLMTVFTYSVYIVELNKPELKKLEPEIITFYVMLFGGFIFSVFSYSTTGIELIPDTSSLLNLIGLALFATVLSNLTLVAAVKHAGSTITSILGSLEPVVATMIGVFHFSEPFGWNSLIGLLLIIGAVTLVILTNKEQAK
ncbi:drug/metabolite transporter (DMT)-like permease [Dysgonomonas sp. PFB1-18]|uniref:DMT family transporter n=1 Tax=unclassified Dysgonomonas TaxID=2630389 RepID=UPI00247722D7|nr:MULTISPECIES: EamA family transporter [unclassified Dysgonomonas]MDH6309909.1 drug/metabolite transporter (DMT)-like permease [Dysgonomonas sp. PF1-14]MDH6339453.1 drug/metabolite transporter (DMT)-like permease [Dysgonomonas sp. PF1-16]MDH6380953.1 drug/metabolite transporter (DMT)-like permease [Dysgonomonas sp. PFB1-18]MDH6397962.1 drug/metabolite transporter (DMT)-like permease [Dysgonomonas sp. PF1-23]